MPESWTINSETTLKAFFSDVEKKFREHKYLTYLAPRIGPDRSIDQNSLFHVWLTEFAAHLANCNKKDVTDGMVEGIKKTVKGLFYRDTGYEWMIHKVWCPLSKREKIDYTSSKKWKQGEMFLVLNWVQMFAAQKGLVLESKGEHAKLTRDQSS
jgi:hypothetical protein